MFFKNKVVTGIVDGGLTFGTPTFCCVVLDCPGLFRKGTLEAVADFDQASLSRHLATCQSPARVRVDYALGIPVARLV